MNRRGFFKAIGTAVLGAAIALRLPDKVHLPEPEESTSARFISGFDGANFVSRMDVLYGYGVVRPGLLIRIGGA